MEESQVESALRALVLKNSRLELSSIAGQDTLAGDLGFDSLAFLSLLSDLEDTFGIPLPVEAVDELKDITFAQLIRMVDEKLGGSVGLS